MQRLYDKRPQTCTRFHLGHFNSLAFLLFCSFAPRPRHHQLFHLAAEHKYYCASNDIFAEKNAHIFDFEIMQLWQTHTHTQTQTQTRAQAQTHTWGRCPLKFMQNNFREHKSFGAVD